MSEAFRLRSGWALVVLASLLAGDTARGQDVDWKATAEEAVRTLQAYIRIDSSNPPGDVTNAAALLTGTLEREAIAVTRYESAPGKVIVVARLKGTGTAKPILLLHHMDVVPADRRQWSRDPFGGEVVDGEVWGRGAMDMKGIGVAHLYAFLTLKRQAIPLSRDVILMAVPDEEVGGVLGARWMIEHHYAELDPEYVLDEGGFGTRDALTLGKLVYGISVAEKKIMWIRIRAEGVAGHGSQPHDQNANDRLTRALARLLGHRMPAADMDLLTTLKNHVGPLAANKFTNAIQHSTISLTTLRSGVGDPPKVNVIPSVAEATIDCRLLPGVSAEKWLDDLRRALDDPTLRLEVIYESEGSIVTPDDTPMYRALASSIARHSPGALVVPIIIPYGTDSNRFRHQGTKSYGIFPAVLSADIVGSMHGDAERVPADQIGAAARILFDALIEVAARANP